MLLQQGKKLQKALSTCWHHGQVSSGFLQSRSAMESASGAGHDLARQIFQNALRNTPFLSTDHQHAHQGIA
jgi:hypothetical protein